MNCKCNKLIIGLIIGIILPLIMSYILYAFLYHGDLEFFGFVQQMVKQGNVGKLLSISVLPNLIIRITSYNVCYTKLLRG